MDCLLIGILCFLSHVSAFQFSEDEYATYQRALDIVPHMAKDDELYYGTFPEGFNWCTATSAYQIEGAWDVDGKGESIWDRKSHTGGIVNNQTGDVACNSYYQYSDDIANLVYLGVTHYRFSIAWTRIQPTGEDTEPNPAGLAYYNNVIDGLLAAGITPLVTLYHWDLPQALHEKGGWLEESVIVSAFTEYARMCYEAFGDRVKNWITFNEPYMVAHGGYENGVKAPDIIGEGDFLYVVTHNLLKAHAEAYHLYDEQFRPTQNGEIGITLNTPWSEPRNRSIASDVDASMRDLEFHLGWFANPVYVNGDYPDVMKSTIAENSALQGFNQSRLPTFTESEKQRIVGTSDFFGINFYTSNLVRDASKPINPPSFDSDKSTNSQKDPDWPTSGSEWLRMTPFGMRKILAYIDSKYSQPRILITENGISDRNQSMTDDHRIRYYKHYTNNVLQAIDLDGVNVFGYTAWSLMDNFEWAEGYVEKFGMYKVDFEDPARPRTAKDSANWYKQLITDNGFYPTL